MWRSSLRRSGALTAAAVLSVHAAAAEVVLTFGLEQRLESGRNVDLTVPEGGQSTTSVTRLSFSAVSRTPLDVLEFTASGALVLENSDDTDGFELQPTRPDFAIRYTREVPNALFSVGAQYRRDVIDAFDDGLDGGDLGGTRTDYGADLRLETGRTAPLGFAFTTSFLRTEYDDTTDPDLTDTDTLLVGAETVLRFSEVTLGRAGLGYEREQDRDLPGTASEALTASVGLTIAMPNGEATADLRLRSDDDEGGRTSFEIGRTVALPAASVSARLGVTKGDGSGTDVIGGLTWSQELPRGSVEVLLERTVGYDDDVDGTVTGTNFSVSLAHEINAFSSMGLAVFYGVSDEPTERIELFEVAATYRYALTEDWGLDSGVRYRERQDSDGRSESPFLFVALSRGFEFRP